jgi:membrane-associated phospholipid phosphatase
MRTPAGPVIEFGVFSPAASATATTIRVSHSARFIGDVAQRAKARISQPPDRGAVPSGLATYTIGRVRTPSHEGSDGGAAAIVAVAISAACWIVFVALAIVVSTSDTLSVDQSVLTWVGEHRSSGVTSAMRTVTWLGSAAVLYPATFVLALHWWRRDRDWRAGAMLAAGLAGSTVLYNIFKRITERPRPPASDALGTYSHWSFPSGHATQCMAFFAMLLVLAWLAGRARRLQLWAIAAAVVALAVGASRIYLGAHWFTDVLGGYALGGAWVALLTAAGPKTILRAPPRDR